MAAAPAAAQTAGSAAAPERTLTTPRSYDEAPRGWSRTARQAIAAAGRVPEIRAEVARFADARDRAYQAPGRRWQVSWYVGEGTGADEIAQVHVDDRTGEVLEAWTGHQVAWTMARGYPGAFGRSVNSPWIWIALCALFVAPFARPPLRMIHLDLAVLLSFGIGYAWFNAAQLGVSVPLAYPPLLYLLGRVLWVAWRRPPAGPPTWMSLDQLVIAIVFLIGFRVGLNVTDGNVIDVGYSGVIGADRITSGEPLYGAFPSDNEHGDTYGPALYLAYVPFELALPFRGVWDDLPAAHAAAIAFDLAVAGLLALLGRRAGGPRTGALMAYAWLAFPFSVLVSNSGANDALVGALVLGALLALGRPAARGALVALAGLTKLAPLALAPLLARGRPLRFAAGFAAAAVLVTVPAVAGGGLGELPGRTAGFQGDRDSPFSVWGYYDGLDALLPVAQAAALAFALALGLVRRPPDLVAAAALATAVLIALQIAAAHWFYLYLAWFVPPLLVALVAERPRPPADVAPA